MNINVFKVVHNAIAASMMKTEKSRKRLNQSAPKIQRDQYIPKSFKSRLFSQRISALKEYQLNTRRCFSRAK